jgi:D-sedoheptulose 7-phosphate isomerase
MGSDYSSLYCQAIALALEKALVHHSNGSALSLDGGIDLLCAWTKEVQIAGHTIYFVGNGASAMMASHYAIDFTKNAGCRSLCFNDAAFLTAIGNDLGYDKTFELPLRAFLRKGDLLATISSSGNSPNILAAIAVAKEIGARIATFSSMKPDNASRKSGDLNFYVPAKTYGIAESAHHILLHCWLDKFMGVMEWNLKP